MAQYIDKSAVVEEIEKRKNENHECAAKAGQGYFGARAMEDVEILSCLDTIEVKEVDLEKESELIANGIMIGVQANKYHTCVYNTTRCDFNHSHLMLAARKGIELGLKTQKGE